MQNIPNILDGIKMQVEEILRELEELQQLIEVKRRSQELRHLIGIELYTEMLIPDTRGDVLSLLQDLYSLIDNCEDSFQELLIEKPQIPDIYKQDFIDFAPIAKDRFNIKSTTTLFRALYTNLMNN